jgi:hypothetical protein
VKGLRKEFVKEFKEGLWISFIKDLGKNWWGEDLRKNLRGLKNSFIKDLRNSFIKDL